MLFPSCLLGFYRIVLFKKATGLSMSDYRRRNREPPDD